MFNQKGFTLLELMIVVVFVCAIGSIALGIIGASNGNSNISFGINGMMETRCVEGYKFVVDQDGRPRQILDELGKGVRCSTNGGM